jgi:hypothetical protein
MINGILYGLVCGRFLSWFNVDNICIKVLQPITPFKLTTMHYYFVFGLVGMIYGIIHN